MYRYYALPYEEQNEHRGCSQLIEIKVNERMPFEVSLPCRKYDCSFSPSFSGFYIMLMGTVEYGSGKVKET
jgi:hypothetical protein